VAERNELSSDNSDASLLGKKKILVHPCLTERISIGTFPLGAASAECGVPTAVTAYYVLECESYMVSHPRGALRQIFV
jgi:translation initiation factor 2B subunit (eIF-2B alpha/beta/delta family)